MPLDLIGAGLGRTGTRSLKDALAIVGYGPAYHMVDLFADPSRLGHWEDATAGRPVDWEALFDGYRSVIDYPGCCFWRELKHAYPAAKVLLSVRDPVRWHESVMSTIYPSSGASSHPIHRMVRELVWEGQFGGRADDREHALAVWDAHVAEVKAGVPAEDLLVWEARDGWEPLCAFLGVDVPDVPFPHVNTRDEFNSRSRGPR